MESKLFSDITSVLYQNRYCDQEDFDLIVSEVTSDKDLKCFERKNYKGKYPSYTNLKLYILQKYIVFLI